MGENKGYIRNADEKGSINISEDVVAVIAAAAASEVEGVHGLHHMHGKEISSTAGKKGVARGIRLLMEEDSVVLDVYAIVEIGYSVNEVGAEIQKAVGSAVESTVGAKVSAVNVSICGVALKKSSVK